MKNWKRPLLLTAAILFYATSAVYADVAILPAFLIVGGAFILLVALVIIALVLLLKALRNKKKRAKEKEKEKENE